MNRQNLLNSTKNLKIELFQSYAQFSKNFEITNFGENLVIAISESSVIRNLFLKFGKFEPDDSYKLCSHIYCILLKKSVYVTLTFYI